MRYFLLVILTTQVFSAWAQHLSNLGRFEVDFIKGCAPLDITITNLQQADCPCDISFGDGGTAQQNIIDPNTVNYTYLSPGTYTLEVTYQSLVPRTDMITIEVVDNIPPEFDILTCSANRATLDITDNNYDQYAIDFDNDGIFENIINQGNPIPPHTYPVSGPYTIAVKGINLISSDNCTIKTKVINALNTLPAPDITSVSLVDQQSLDIGYTPQPNIVNRLEIATNNTSNFQVLSTLDNTQTTTSISNASINAEANYYCFRIGSFDACTNSSTYSPVICTLNLDLSVEDGQNVLDWNDVPSITNYTVCTNGTCNLNTVASSFTDINAICNTDYCYIVKANYTNGATSTSFERCGTAFSTLTPDPIEDLVIQTDQGQIQLLWSDPLNFSPAQYNLLRTWESESDYFPDVSSPRTEAIEENTGPYCYQLSYTDICNNQSNVPLPVCSMYLVGTAQEDNSILLTWNPFTGYNAGVMEYRVEKYDQAGFLQTSFTTTDTQLLDDNDISIFQIMRYKVFAVPVNAALPEAYSNQVRVVKPSKVSYPKAFTPNGDGLNDEFLVYATYVKTFNLKVYNRWGELIFTSNQITNGWDGTYKGELMPSGSYSFAVKVTDLANRTWDLSGFFALIRK